MTDLNRNPGHDLGYWRSMAELSGSEDFEAKLAKEFPEGLGGPGQGLSRRRFLQLMSASLAMTGLAGCRWPEEKIVPYVNRPEGVTPGKPLQFATAFELGAVPLSVLATSYDGRPIKIDGNPEFSLSGGASNVFAQASVLDLYDPDRSRHPKHRVNGACSPATWEDFAAVARDLAKGRTAVLCEETSSPSIARLLDRMGSAGAGLYTWEPVSRESEIAGARKAFGRDAKAQLDLRQARVIVDFDANLLQDHPSALRNTREFSAGRNPDTGQMNRLYVYETSFSITGGMADHRFPTAARDIGPAVWALAAQLVLEEGLALPANSGIRRDKLEHWRGHEAATVGVAALAKDLMANRGHGLLIAGSRQSPDVHALLHVLNAALDNAGRTIRFIPRETPKTGTIAELTADLKAGRVETLLILGGNPVYSAPVDLDFKAALAKAALKIHLSDRDDETSRLCDWHLPRSHYLESWGDAVAWDGTQLAVQPLIRPLYDSRTAAEVLSLVLDETPRNGHAIARDTLWARRGGRGSAPEANDRFEKAWRRFIHDGLQAPASDMRGGQLPLRAEAIHGPAEGHSLGVGNLEIVFAQDQSLYDGRFANNAWLQEMPDFMSKLTWDNAAIIGPATADELGVKHGDLIELDYEGRRLEMAVYVLPGQARYSVTVNLGYGRDQAGAVAAGAGFNVYALRTSAALHHGEGLKINKTGRSYTLATTQDHHAIDTAGAEEIQKRVPGLVREGTLEHYHADEHFVDHLGVHSPPLESLWKEFEYEGHKWGMGIDLNTCTGCNACTVACQSENNIAVVGKDEVARGREMSWIRMDRYFMGDVEDPSIVQQPVACTQCELAPCESVCPVAATVHTDEGLNAMVYNRCVGTRYCSNNCPYKVRRFNWFNNFEDQTETQRMVLNPEVTVRARGVMEKCTYCVQRIESARVEARIEGREIRDGDITTACQQACPADAIVFGDLNDAQSRVSKLREKNRSYDLLNYLNLKPRTFYMARIRNPNPAIEPGEGVHGQGGAGHAGQHGEDHG